MSLPTDRKIIVFVFFSLSISLPLSFSLSLSLSSVLFLLTDQARPANCARVPEDLPLQYRISLYLRQTKEEGEENYINQSSAYGLISRHEVAVIHSGQ